MGIAAKAGSPHRDPWRFYNGQVYFVPDSSWRMAVFGAARSTRFVTNVAVDETLDPVDFARMHAVHSHSPVLWYTPGGTLSDEVYEFLHRLPAVASIIILAEHGADNLDELDPNNLNLLDLKNLKALVNQCAWEERIPPFIDSSCKGVHRFPLFPKRETPPFEDELNDASVWLDLDRRLHKKAPRQARPLPRIAVTLPPSPQMACALAPLAAYVQAPLIFVHPQGGQNEQTVELLTNAALADDGFDEIWCAGPPAIMGGLAKSLEKRIAEMRREHKRYERTFSIRVLPAQDHNALSHLATMHLLGYKFLDWMIVQSLGAKQGEELQGRGFFFNFLASGGMRNLYLYCNQVLDLAEQVRHRNYDALVGLHDVYWAMNDQERRDFIQQFQSYFNDKKIVARSMAVIADYAVDEAVPHNLIDAAAFAARRQAPLLLLRPLPTETSYYVGSLMDKIEDQLDRLNKEQIDQFRLHAERPQIETPLGGRNSDDELLSVVTDGSAAGGNGRSTAHNARPWSQLRQEIEAVRSRISALNNSLWANIVKTGEVLYESLVPLAMRDNLSQLNPNYLAVFIQDPSLPIELVRECGNPEPGGAGRTEDAGTRLGALALLESDRELQSFWSLKYSIGHISSVNYYETNFASNISYFTRRPAVAGKLHVLLCSNPTKDLYFSMQEAEKISDLFRKKRVVVRGKEVTLFEPRSQSSSGSSARTESEPSPEDMNAEWLDVDRLSNDCGEGSGCAPATRDRFIEALRSGYDIVHYSGHAFFDTVLPGRSGLLLSDGVLTASDVRFMLDLNRSPIIYANACAAGRIKSISARFTGLAGAFIRSGAVGYISPLWSIDDRDAASLAVAYYSVLLREGASVGECLRLAKQAQFQLGSITWASLVLYGDPTLYIVEPGTEPMETTRLIEEGI